MNDMYFSDCIFAAEGEYDEVIKAAVQRESEREENIALKRLINSFVDKTNCKKV